jgi:hypothetical protein
MKIRQGKRNHLPPSSTTKRRRLSKRRNPHNRLGTNHPYNSHEPSDAQLAKRRRRAKRWGFASA